MKNHHFKTFLNNHVLFIQEKTKNKSDRPYGISKTKIYSSSGLTRQIIYRWQQKNRFPKPTTLFLFLKNTLSLIKIEDEEFIVTHDMMKNNMDMAYQALLLDFYEQKELSFC